MTVVSRCLRALGAGQITPFKQTRNRFSMPRSVTPRPDTSRNKKWIDGWQRGVWRTCSLQYPYQVGSGHRSMLLCALGCSNENLLIVIVAVRLLHLLSASDTGNQKSAADLVDSQRGNM